MAHAQLWQICNTHADDRTDLYFGWFYATLTDKTFPKESYKL